MFIHIKTSPKTVYKYFRCLWENVATLNHTIILAFETTYHQQRTPSVIRFKVNTSNAQRQRQNVLTKQNDKKLQNGKKLLGDVFNIHKVFLGDFRIISWT